MKRIYLFALVFLATAAYGEDLRLSGKGIEFYLNLGMGAFYAENPAPNTPALRTLLFADNPPTSYITLVVDGKPYKLNDHALTQIEPFHETTDTITALYGIGSVTVRVTFQVTNSALSQNDTVLCYLTYKNTTNTTVNVGARFLFDTFYDERWGKPYIYLSTGEQVKTERLIYPESFPNFIYSGNYDSDDKFKEGLFIYPYVNDLKPAYIIIGNWKKLDENELDYQIDPRSDFRYNSYANKDAAIAIFFDSIALKASEELSFGTVLSRSQFQFAQYVAGRYVADIIQAVTEVNPVVTNTNVAVTPPATNTNAVAVVTNRPVEPVVTNQSVAVHSPATNVVTVFVTNAMTPRAVSNLNELEIMRLQLETLNKLTTLIEKLDNRLTEAVVTQAAPRLLTNVVTNTAAIDALKQQYETALTQQRTQYETRLSNQTCEYQTQMDTLQTELERSSASSMRNVSIEQLDATINDLDQKIKLIEQLERMNLDFSTMPESELRRLHEQIEAIENRVLRTQQR